MQRDQVDILISGGGVAGLVAAAAFGGAGFSVICVDPAPPVTDAQDQAADLRSTAFLQPAKTLLEQAGVWPRLAPYAAPLQIMRILDAGGAEGEVRRSCDFDAADISDLPFGWNLPNWLIRRELLAHLANQPNVRFWSGVGTSGVLPRLRQTLITLSDGRQIAARLLVAADGRASPVRQALGIDVKTLRYGQKALAFAVTHPIPHRDVSTEIHRSGGPFTLVPLPDLDGKPASAVVWMELGAEAARLEALPVTEFEAEMSLRSCHVLGPLTLVSRRSVWPIISQIADRMDGPRCALIAEAAHVMPPIGAQGLNTSLADLAALLRLALVAPDDLGSPTMLTTYNRERHGQTRVRVAGIDLLNRASMLGVAPWRDLRGAALGALHGATPVRHKLMKAGLGLR